MAGKLDAIKKRLALLARDITKCEIPVGPVYPTKWWFDKVIDPRSKKPFTYFGTWEFIAEMLEDETTVLGRKKLDKPPEVEAYKFTVKTNWGTIYIKVHFGKGDVIVGRSFHY